MDFIGRCGSSGVLMRFSRCKQKTCQRYQREEGGSCFFKGISLEIEHQTVSNLYNWRKEHRDILGVFFFCETGQVTSRALEGGGVSIYS